MDLSEANCLDMTFPWRLLTFLVLYRKAVEDYKHYLFLPTYLPPSQAYQL